MDVVDHFCPQGRFLALLALSLYCNSGKIAAGRFCMLGQSDGNVKANHNHNALDVAHNYVRIYCDTDTTVPSLVLPSPDTFSLHSSAAYVTKMLPFPIFLLLLFSATILAPSPHSIISFIRTATLQSSAWSTLPMTVSSSVSRSPLETIPGLPILIPQVFLDISPTTCGPSPTHEALSDATIPYSSIHATDDYPLNIAVLLVILLVMFNYLVWSSLFPVSPD